VLGRKERRISHYPGVGITTTGVAWLLRGVAPKSETISLSENLSY
jgi:hypothetical protein